MHFTTAALLAAVGVFTARAQDQPTCEINHIPVNEDDFGEPAWETIIEEAFPTWEVPDAGCPRLGSVGGELLSDFGVFPTPEEEKFNPCYYTKAFAGLDPSKGGYPTPIDTHYPYEFAAPFLRQPGDGSTHHCPSDAVNIAECPKVGNDCGEPDCATISDEYGIGHIPPFVPLAAIKNAYNACEQDVCSWFHYETSGCNIKKSVLDELVYEYFGQGEKIKYQPPILLDGQPSSTYFRLEYGGESPACDEGNCRGPHYCSVDVADSGVIWGDFCPYVHTGENSGKYRHPHIALAALELWIANKCMPDKCPTAWLESPNGQGYGTDSKLSTSITWSEMDDNKNPIAQPLVPYEWPNAGNGIFPGHELYNGMRSKPAPGVYVNEVVEILEPAPTEAGGVAEASSVGRNSVKLTFAIAVLGTIDIFAF
ncbi:expressed unknown protein [Seminavis robusta]|uniref:Uncharacterized protein n=1 Tax=Seminavis robusta TaxID=568900 RepID=A0A9N8DV51_9STRA|nr:expressed unknown protein [Seminavis robusta]|eukprot:Sro393_g133710.1 n/a (424) ;mRNA; f:57815-59086